MKSDGSGLSSTTGACLSPGSKLKNGTGNYHDRPPSLFAVRGMSGQDVDIGADIGDAIQGYIKALRILNRKKTSVLAIANALSLPPGIVERAFSEFKFRGGKLSPNRRVAKTLEWSRAVELKP